MAEPAVGAVSLLLGVIRKEAALLGGVGADVQFIKEEMESMKSFLAHLARTAPPGGEHNEQVRTWMDQVRRFALDCNGCIDLYLYRGHREAHRASWGGLRSYVLWLPWLLQKMAAQHRAANQLRELKDRARDISERRSRYGVEVPTAATKAAAVLVVQSSSPPDGTAAGPAAAATPPLWAGQVIGGGDEQEQDDGDDADDRSEETWTDRSARRGAAMGALQEIWTAAEGVDLQDYLKRKLEEWMTHHVGQGNRAAGSLIPSVAIVAPHPEDAVVTMDEIALSVHKKQHYFHNIIVSVDIPALHSPVRPLHAKDILFYIFRELGEPEPMPQELIFLEKENFMRRVNRATQHIKPGDNLKELSADLSRCTEEFKQLIGDEQLLNGKLMFAMDKLPFGIILMLLHSASVDEQVTKKATPTLLAWHDEIISETAKKLKFEIEQNDWRLKQVPWPEEPIHLDEVQYARILHEVFPKTSNRPTDKEAVRKKTTSSPTSTLSADQVKEMIHKAKLEILHEVQVQQGKSKSKQKGPVIEEATEVTETIEKTAEKLSKIIQKIRELMIIKGIVDKIQNRLKDARALIILKIDHNYVLDWEEARYALSLSDCIASAVIVADNQRAKEYCCPPQEPIDYSIVGMYHDSVLQLTTSKMQQMNEEDNSHNNSQILRAILDACKPYELCMKMFGHVLYANPHRNKQDLHKLHRTLQEVSPKSLGSIMKKILKFSYNNIPEEYKSCLLYLSIFPKGHRIRRSTLIGRWIVEGLITREDWPTSVRQAERCFDTLIDWCLVYPVDIGATGKAKGCMVGHLVHEFIFKMASKRHIVEARLSNHLARHFSIFNDLQLLASQTIHSFLRNLSVSSRLSLIKVLDLEGCRFGRKGKRYLKDICRYVVLLKYLSLRRTDVKQIPNEINNLHDLEVLDIRHTKVCMSATESLLLLKLKRLLAGHNNLSQSSIDIGMPIRAEELSTVHVPKKIGKMVNMEVLSNVKARNSQDLISIARLWQLRKLGIVIDDKVSHLWNLVDAVSDLHQCLRFLSITIVPSEESLDSSSGFDRKILRYTPKLESLSISGTTDKVQLLQLLLAQKHNNQLTKVTLCKTYLSQNDLEALAMLPNLQCVRLRHKAYKESKLTFKVDEFQHLKYFLVEGFDLTDIIFENGAVGELEKIVLPLSDDLNLYGVDKLTRLKEIELNNNNRNKSNSSVNNINSITTATTNTSAATATTDAPTTDAINVTAPTTNTTAVASAVTNTKINTSDTTPANITTSTATATAANTDDTAPTTENNTAATTSIDATASATPTIANASTPAVTTKTTATAPTMNTSPAPPTSNTTAPITADTAPTVTTATIITNMFLSLLENAKAITKVTLCDTMLKEVELQILAKKPTISCLVLLNKSCAERQLTFNKNDFPKLSLLILECDNMELSFTAGSCPKLKRFVWIFTKIESLSGIDNLPRLEEVEFKGDYVPNEVKEAINKLKNRVHYTYYESEKQDQAEGNPLEEEDNNVPKFSCF